MTRPSVVLSTCILAVAMGALILPSACGGKRPRTGSETNFLKSCDATCEDGLSCVCGVCTRLCSDDDACSGLADGAECVADFGAGSTDQCAMAEDSFCERLCSEDTDCESLGDSFVCDGSHCRERDQINATDCPTLALSVGDNERTIDVGGTSRSYIVYVPESFSGDLAAPLILDFHPLAGNAETAENTSGYRELSETEGFIVAYPEGIDAAWNIGPCCTESRDVDDVEFARALVADIQSQACIDAKRIYAVGNVMGGGMAYQLACNAADLFAGIAPSAFDLLAEEDQPCGPSEPVTVISYRSSDDALVPYEGGAEPAPNLPDVTMNFLGAVGTFERWAELNECAGDPSAPDADGCSTYSDCAGGVEVTLCTNDGGGASWLSAEDGWATLSEYTKP